MRRILRADLPHRLLLYLEKKQHEVESGGEVSTLWKQARKTRAMKQVFEILASMGGGRQRCMFCEDSRGVDIDHFWPKDTYPERAFVWENFILSCSGCNRAKERFFQLGAHGRPLLMDPTREDPWEYLFFDSRTGIITARFLTTTGQVDPCGHYTVEASGPPLYHQAVTEGRLRTYRNLVRCVKRYLEVLRIPNASSQTQAEFVDCINDNSDHGLIAWFFEREGRDEEPFSILHKSTQHVWVQILGRQQSQSAIRRACARKAEWSG